jgi:hypothetical protein
MVKTKKAPAAWYIAGLHFLIAGFLIPLTAAVIGMFTFSLMFGLLAMLAFPVISIAATWFGVTYSGRLLRKIYVISNPKRVVILSTSYYIVLGAILVGANYAAPLAYITAITVFGGAVAFYVAGIRYLMNTEISSNSVH